MSAVMGIFICSFMILYLMHIKIEMASYIWCSIWFLNWFCNYKINIKIKRYRILQEFLCIITDCNLMIYIKTVVIFIVSVFILTGHSIPKSDVFAQVISNNLEESDVYIQLSNILDNTENNLGNVVQAINSGEKDNALNIISNITMNIKEIRNGLNLIVDNPIHGGD